MKARPVTFEQTFDAPVTKVWTALTDKDEMRNWYFDLKEFKPEVGFEFRFYGGREGRQYLHVCIITDVIPQKKLSHSWKYDGYDGISYVTFELFAEGNQTRLLLTHEGLESLPSSNPDFAACNFVEGWTGIINNSLRNYLEGK